MRVKTVAELTQKPDVGCYIYGLFMEGARWDREGTQLIESRPKELYTEMAVIWLIPKANRKPPTSGVYVCPIYKTITRAGGCTQQCVQRMSRVFLRIGLSRFMQFQKKNG